MDNISELRTKNHKELTDQVLVLKKELLNLRFQHKAGELQNTARVKVVRRQVARVRTVLGELSAKKEVK